LVADIVCCYDTSSEKNNHMSYYFSQSSQKLTSAAIVVSNLLYKTRNCRKKGKYSCFDSGGFHLFPTLTCFLAKVVFGSRV
jgi:hypothetical protein